MHSFGVSSNHTNKMTFTDLVPLIIFILKGVAIAIVIVAAGLWIAGRRRREKEQEGGKLQGGESTENAKNEEWGA